MTVTDRDDGYPTKEDLETIEKWDFIKKGTIDLIELIEKLWHWPEWGVVKRWGYRSFDRKRVLKLELHTGGWSGNEGIIAALQKSMFWSLYWEKSERGGHYYFEIPYEMLRRKQRNSK
ncbi:MAG: hypothetical protein ACPLSA_00145 [Caldanaerobacter sp.]